MCGENHRIRCQHALSRHCLNEVRTRTCWVTGQGVTTHLPYCVCVCVCVCVEESLGACMNEYNRRECVAACSTLVLPAISHPLPSALKILLPLCMRWRRVCCQQHHSVFWAGLRICINAVALLLRCPGSRFALLLFLSPVFRLIVFLPFVCDLCPWTCRPNWRQ